MLLVDPSAVTPVSVWANAKVLTELSSLVWLCLTNISTFPAVPGDLEDIADVLLARWEA